MKIKNIALVLATAGLMSPLSVYAQVERQVVPAFPRLAPLGRRRDRVNRAGLPAAGEVRAGWVEQAAKHLDERETRTRDPSSR